jgi:hypothetical protein
MFSMGRKGEVHFSTPVFWLVELQLLLVAFM